MCVYLASYVADLRGGAELTQRLKGRQGERELGLVIRILREVSGGSVRLCMCMHVCVVCVYVCVLCMYVLCKCAEGTL